MNYEFKINWVFFYFVISWNDVLSSWFIFKKKFVDTQSYYFFLAVPLGMIFSCFMVCIMIGSSLFSTLMSKNWTPGETLQSAATIFAICTGFCTYTAHPNATNSKRNGSFMAFLLLETSIGLYFPSIGVLRSQVKYICSFWLETLCQVQKNSEVNFCFKQIQFMKI